MVQSFISASRLAGEPYSGIIGYPGATRAQVRSRISEMGRLGVDSVSFAGPTSLGGLCVLGKGYAGVVVLARMGRRRVALKVRRTDSQRGGMEDEAELLRIANSVGVGPRALAASRNFLAMEYIDGERIGRWLEGLGGRGTAAMVKAAVRGALEGCRRLDEVGLDHGELSNVSKHLIVGGGGAHLIDFESASTGRRPSNVTSITQAIFIGSGIARGVGRAYGVPPREEIIGALRRYKHEWTRESFEGLLGVLKL